MSQLDIFNYQDHQVRTIADENGEPWFVASDVAKILGYRDAANMTRRLDPEDLRTHSVSTSAGERQATIISEPGLYAAVLGSQVEGAKAFKRWVTHEVVPSIRRHGGYMTPQKIEEVLTNPDTIIQLATNLKKERAAREELELKVEADRPAVEYHDQFVARHDLITIRTLANQINVKETVIRDALVERRWLWRHSIERMNSKGQKVTEYKYGVYSPYKKYFVLVNNHTAPRLFGEVRTTVKVTPAGAQAVEKMFSKQEVLEVA
ncbi:BRO family protein [uncultured Kocuria sp.]|uniref:BRO family protein n=1 Tax=uncultured Kocuria sp. TaxID=259305 RepID=UPI00069CF990|nr:BRO family protein [uncultured Kocuria sp.]MCT1367208.1 phage antirepressor [Rothia sp. p3-SID1597]